ncbi:DUF72 domain-containing protein [Rhizobium hidalgonense]|uniref:DUF72 domain-containing protein n=2 Tax=Rhizobium hidalgonense TaxID=1538159 RepID=A0AAJ2H107_9HYPH|nr:DUF72 domain-containing protein [Rhizobium hidalgonense]MDR9776929.1 DUF72 domain-containing protein [Rhizobium hidalgonense]MDR9814018.1 DUF72 domain-containing protein [Rhizobium hidalgonense]MDR9820662.1 DUF72 domain-containing protein [Rhizobium hidalgonense]PON08018.1 hypothetical protein ATY29_08035 [Rhizobium hidalgonense]
MATTRSPEEIEQRRLRRAERREAQRQTNLARAAKMHDVRINSTIEPPEPSTTLARAVNIGCSGWYYWHWKGQFYPEGAERSEWFSIYQDRFDTVELNAPFYNWPTVATIRTWLRQAREDFVYTVKVSELITHIKRFDGTADLIKDFGFIADTLGPRMGCLLFQLPPSAKFDPVLLDTILGQLEPRHRNVVEFRHKSWWNDEVFAAFESAGAIFCSTSGPRLPDQLVKTADDIYIRFHGVEQWYRHDYSQRELQAWAERIHQSGAKRVWAYFNNDRNAYAIKNAKMLDGILTGSN